MASFGSGGKSRFGTICCLYHRPLFDLWLSRGGGDGAFDCVIASSPPLHLTVKWSALKSEGLKFGRQQKKVSAWLPSSFDTFPSFKSAWLPVWLSVCLALKSSTVQGKKKHFRVRRYVSRIKRGKMKAAAAEAVSAGATTLARKKIVKNKRQFWHKESIHNCRVKRCCEGKDSFSAIWI